MLNFLESERISLKSFPIDDTWKVGVDGDGSCFFNCICLAFVKEYRNMKLLERQQYVEKLRAEISNYFTREIYEELKQHYLKFLKPEYIKEVLPSYIEIKKDIKNPYKWVGDNIVLIVCRILEINVFIYNIHGKFEENLYFGKFLDKKYPSCIIYHEGGVHYELVGIHNKNNTLEVIFNPTEEIHNFLSLLVD